MSTDTTAIPAAPDELGHFGTYGGRFAGETLMPLLLELEREYERAQNDPEFHVELERYLKN
jgi:tryptophan synthase beta chain